MINFLSSWAKNIGIAIVIVSILEMILPNNKTKKYIKMVMGIYILFAIILPFLQNKINLQDLNAENYIETSTKSEVNQTSMDARIEELYVEQLKKDITSKIEQKGYKVNKCEVTASITKDVNTTKINKIVLKVEKDSSKKEQNNSNIENVIISEVEKIKDIEIDSENQTKEKKLTISKTEEKELKKFLKEEYEVSEECLVIN